MARRDDLFRLSISGQDALVAIRDARRAQVANEAIIPVAARVHQRLTDLISDTDLGECMVQLLDLSSG